MDRNCIVNTLLHFTSYLHLFSHAHLLDDWIEINMHSNMVEYQ